MIINTNGIINYIANNRESKLHSVEFDIESPRLKRLLNDNQFLAVRQRLTQLIVRYGKGAIFAIPFNKDWIVQEAQVLTVRMFMRRYVEYIRLVNRNYYYTSDGLCHDLFTTFNVVDSVMYIEQWYETPNDDGKGIKNIVSKWNVDWNSKAVPVWVFSHNAEWIDDITKAGAHHLIEQYSNIIGDLSEEWMFTRTGGVVNKNFTKMTAEDYETKKKDGNRYITDNSFNSKLQEGIGTTISGSSSIADVINLTNYIKDQIFHLVGVQRDEPQGTKQVGSLEIMNRQDAALDTLYKIKTCQQKQWDMFFNDICVILGIKKEQPELQLSIIENMKLESAQASIIQLKGSVAKTPQSDAENDKSDAENDKSGAENDGDK